MTKAVELSHATASEAAKAVAPSYAAPEVQSPAGHAPSDDCGESARDARREALRAAPTVMVSACLLGEACRYDGRSQRSERVLAALEGKAVIPICPEAAAGLGIPRPPVDLAGGTGVDVWAGRARALTRETREDRTAAFQDGAQQALEAARRFDVTVALLKEKSPSCGSQRVYETGVLRPGEGITTALLRADGRTVVSDEDL
ncbi:MULTISPECIES: DUF523 domain-containing protein [Corallococcus]|nr:DUF523 domain-containing protein [Corallococcus sp. AB032C]